MNRTITVSEKFQIIMSDNQYTVQQLHDVDPTDSPRFDPSKHSTEIRQVWKDVGYYSLSPNGLIAAIKRIVINESANGESTISLRSI